MITIRIDVNERLQRPGGRGYLIPLRCYITQPRANRQDKIRLVQRIPKDRWCVKGKMAGKIRMGMIEDILASPRDGHGDIPTLREIPEGRPASLKSNLTAGD